MSTRRFRRSDPAAIRRLLAIVRATALEILSEPLVLMVMVSAAAVATLAPAMHYHQFGDATRMAREAGLSALLLGGSVVAVFAALRTFRQELESGTAMSALARPISRTGFFLAKTLGAALVYALFALAVTAVSLTVTVGAAIGGEVAASGGQIARLWGPSLMLAVAAIVLPLVIAAAANRFRAWRFTLCANLLLYAFALAGTLYRFDWALAARVLPLYALCAVPPAVFLCFAAAFSTRWRMNAAASLTGLIIVAFLPALGGYCLSDVVSAGGRVSLAYVALAYAAAMPAAGGALALGAWLFNGKDIG